MKGSRAVNEPVLVERDALLSRGEDVLRRARRSEGGLIVFEGPPGIGKSVLLDALARRSAGFAVARARPAYLEQAFPFGVARILLMSLLRGRSRAERGQLLAGPGRAARQVLDGRDAAPLAAQSLFFGMFTVLAFIAAEQPVALFVDDAQWADLPSLGWLRYTVAHAADVAIAVIIAEREGTRTVLAGLEASDGVEIALVPALTQSGVSSLIARTLRAAPSRDMVDAAVSATRGNPFLVEEFARGWTAGAGEPGAVVTSRLRHRVMYRIAGAHPAAVGLAEAVAILGGDGVALTHAASLAGIDRDDALQAADALCAADVLAEGPALSFIHPIVQESVIASIGPLRASVLHAGAAVQLHERGAPTEVVGAQLLVAAPGYVAEAVPLLRRAAREALQRGAPASAAPFLLRALTEPVAATERVEILHALGEAQALAHDPAAESTLRAALNGARGRRAGEIAVSLGRLLIASGRGADAEAVLEAQLAEVGDVHSELAITIRTELLAVVRAQPGRAVPPLHLPVEAQADLPGETRAERLLLASLSSEASMAGMSRSLVKELADRAFAGGALLADEGPEAQIVYFLIASLTYDGYHAEALGHLDAVLAEARRRGSVSGYAQARAWRADPLRRTGRLAEAQADALDALAFATEHGLGLIVPLAVHPLVLVHLDAGEPGSAEAALSRHGFDRTIPDAGLFSGVAYARGRVHMLRGRHRDAAADLLGAGERMLRAQVTTPALLPWRSDAGLALHACGDTARARELIDEEVALAEVVGAPCTLGVALRAQAIISTSDERLGLLHIAEEHLRSSLSPVEHARVLHDLGMAQLRLGARAAGRDNLRAALDLADRQGAHAIAERAHRELLVAGARPRRRRLSGPGSLTPAERRVAEAAAEGKSNREIAAELFLSLKTVETHLGHTFAKLSISDRRSLSQALAESR